MGLWIVAGLGALVLAGPTGCRGTGEGPGVSARPGSADVASVTATKELFTPQTLPPTPAAFPYPEPGAMAVSGVTPDATRLAMSNEEFAELVAAGLGEDPRNTGPFSVVAVADVVPGDLSELTIKPEEVDLGSPTDVAMVIRGHFAGGAVDGAKTYEHLFLVVDRFTGRIAEVHSNNVEDLMSLLPRR
jgi:hypothetical protein